MNTVNFTGEHRVPDHLSSRLRVPCRGAHLRSAN